MTTSEMVYRLRMLLDERTASFFLDADCYSVLTEGQIEIANMLLSQYEARKRVNPTEELPEVLKNLIVIYQFLGIYSANLSLPTDCWKVLSAMYSSNGAAESDLRPAYERAEAIGHSEVNTYMTASYNNPFFYRTSNYIYFDPQVATVGGYRVDYLKRPATISASQDPTIGMGAHNAMVQYAFASLLKRDQKFGEAQSEFEKFLIMVKSLYY